MPVGVLEMGFWRFRRKSKYGRVMFLGSKMSAREREGRAHLRAAQNVRDEVPLASPTLTFRASPKPFKVVNTATLTQH